MILNLKNHFLLSNQDWLRHVNDILGFRLIPENSCQSTFLGTLHYQLHFLFFQHVIIYLLTCWRKTYTTWLVL